VEREVAALNEVALSETPESAADNMSEATERLRERAWMIAPMTSGAAVLNAAGSAEVRRLVEAGLERDVHARRDREGKAERG